MHTWLNTSTSFSHRIPALVIFTPGDWDRGFS
jgi:hypothetical protein